MPSIENVPSFYAIKSDYIAKSWQIQINKFFKSESNLCLVS